MTENAGAFQFIKETFAIKDETSFRILRNVDDFQNETFRLYEHYGDVYFKMFVMLFVEEYMKDKDEKKNKLKTTCEWEKLLASNVKQHEYFMLLHLDSLMTPEIMTKYGTSTKVYSDMFEVFFYLLLQNHKMSPTEFYNSDLSAPMKRVVRTTTDRACHCEMHPTLWTPDTNPYLKNNHVLIKVEKVKGKLFGYNYKSTMWYKKNTKTRTQSTIRDSLIECLYMFKKTYHSMFLSSFNEHLQTMTGCYDKNIYLALYDARGIPELRHNIFVSISQRSHVVAMQHLQSTVTAILQPSSRRLNQELSARNMNLHMPDLHSWLENEMVWCLNNLLFITLKRTL